MFDALADGQKLKEVFPKGCRESFFSVFDTYVLKCYTNPISTPSPTSYLFFKDHFSMSVIQKNISGENGTFI